jgi:polyisoprenoid-binding protein YceI
MKKINVFVVLMFAGVAAFSQTKWTADQVHSKIGFSATHMVVAEVEGNFKDFTASVNSTTDDFNGATVEFTAKTASVSTDNDRRDNHLKSDDFFNAEKFPEIKFSGTLVKEGSKYVLKGNLTMRDVTKPVTLDVTYGGRIKAMNGEKAGFKISGKVNRKDFNLKFDKALEGGGLVVSDEIGINCKVELNKAA